MTFSWIGCLVGGIICLIVGYWAPIPEPIPRILQIIGWILLLLAVLFLVLSLVSGGASVGALGLAPLLM